MSRIARIETFVFRAPIATPILTSFGRMSDRATLFLRIEDDEGASGWGEAWCNFPSVTAEHRARIIDAVIAPMILGRDASDPAALWAELERRLHVIGVQSGEPGALAAALAAADIALCDLAARRARLPLWRWLGGTDGGPVPAYASGLNPDRAAIEAVEQKRAEGFRAFKIKVGFGEARDQATLRPVTDSLRPGERIMVDANQGWDLPAACRMAAMLAEFPLSWIEEPLLADRPAHEWAQVRAASAAPLAGGENLRGSLAFHQALADGLLDVVQPDAAKWGGLSGTLPVARAVLAAGRTYCPHYLGGGVGLLASAHLLAAARGPGLLEVDANPNPLREDVLGALLRPVGGAIALPDGPGLGLVPDLRPFASLRTLHTERAG
ncbi:MAG: mandelate racemase/muconate lactonizing enzyme family protein [Alphaproteobacteria bacterium]|nr:mandelate racemase/muconate lactonizing enzyme family protein [Alphaproteobacteria bacterium]